VSGGLPIWSAAGTNYPAGAPAWSSTATNVAPGYTYFTPGLPFAAQELNSILNTITTRATDKTGDTITGGWLFQGGLINISVAPGIESFVSSGILSNAAGGLISTVAGGIQTSAPGGIQTSAPGGISLNGGTSDWVTFPARTITHIFGLEPYYGTLPNLVSNSANSPPSLGGLVSSLPTKFYIPGLHQGSTLAFIAVQCTIINTHTGVPAVLPNLKVKRGHFFSSTVDDLSSTATQFFPTPGSLAIYNASSYVPISYTCNQNNVVDRTLYYYWLELTDENGANSITGNLYFAASVNFIVTDIQA
jgi:hypothetical protein